MRAGKRLPLAGWASAVLLLATGCLSTNGSDASVKLSVTLSATALVLPQDGTSVALPVTVTGPSGSETVTVDGLPTGITATFTASSKAPSGEIVFTGSATAVSGAYPATVTVSLAGQSATQSLTLTSAPVVKVGATVDTTAGAKGALKQFLSTSFQVAEWTPQIFSTASTSAAQQTQLSSLGPQHIRLQVISNAIPMKAQGTASSSWDFSTLDAIAQPVLASADNSPEFQIAAAPAWMCLSDGSFDITNHLQDFADYAANLVRYYNTGGFVWGGIHFGSASSHKILWWGIFNEFNLNGLTIADYIKLYNTVVPAMQAVDPTIKFVALELSDYGLGTGEAGDPQLYLPAFVAPAGSGGVKAQVDAIGTHLYAGCDQTSTDKTLFAAVPDFVANLQYLIGELGQRTDLASVPVWVTENNISADYATSTGMSNCYPTRTFVLDQRGSSAFFAAWRPYAFAQLAKAGSQALYHWQYTGDKQYGEVDTSGSPYLSYWVDRALAYAFSSTTASPSILTTSSTEAANVEALATLNNSTGMLNVLVTNRAVAAATDNNGAGKAMTIVLDLSNYSLFNAASQTQVDANTNTTTGANWAGITPSQRMTITLPGYGMAIVRLTP